MAFAIRIVFFALIVFAALKLLMYILKVSEGGESQRPRIAASGFKCATCQYCGKLYDDGALCRFGTKETFKNSVHIQNCVDHKRDS